MDIVSHGLWAGTAYKAANKNKEKKFNVKAAAFWGMFPDLFAFTIPCIWILSSLVLGNMTMDELPPHLAAMEPAQSDTLFVLRLASGLYNISHSVFIFLLIFCLVYLLTKKTSWVMGGWLLHIIIDIPTHSYGFFPTPFLWPVSQWKFNGFPWNNPWFMLINYSAIIVVYLLLRNKKTKKA